MRDVLDARAERPTDVRDGHQLFDARYDGWTKVLLHLDGSSG
ncbi:hypothetical protein ACGFX8_23165 [Streptomyces sp. NPDC048362]